MQMRMACSWEGCWSSLSKTEVLDRGKSLEHKLEDLSSKGDMPKKLVDVANGLRKLRNLGAHASNAALTDAEVPVLDNLTRAILEYVYSAPLLAQEAEDRLKALKERKSTKGPPKGYLA